MHYYLDYATNNDWQAETLAELRDTAVSCPFTRTPANAIQKTFFGMNNFVTPSTAPPPKSAADTSNSYEFIKDRIATCTELNNGQNPNFVLVDFWSKGDLVQVTQEHNAALALANQQNRQRQLLETTKTMMIRRGGRQPQQLQKE